MPIFAEDWARLHPGRIPLAHAMRRDGAGDWLRFHTLPAAKRTAESAAETATVLARYSAVGDAVLGRDAPVWLVQACWETPPGATETSDLAQQFKACRDYALAFAFRVVIDDGAGGEEAWTIHAARTVWKEGAFDDLLMAVANEEAAPILFLSPATGAVFAPYDGGMDLFLPAPEDVATLHARFGAWLSPRADGL